MFIAHREERNWCNLNILFQRFDLIDPNKAVCA